MCVYVKFYIHLLIYLFICLYVSTISCVCVCVHGYEVIDDDVFSDAFCPLEIDGKEG